MAADDRVRVRRVYEDPVASDGVRVLVDRLWPRGVSKEAAAVDRWLRDVAPSDALRRWYSHDRQRFDEFAERYRAELRQEPGSSALPWLLEQVRGGRHVTLLTATRDVEHAHAQVLAGLLRATRA